MAILKVKWYNFQKGYGFLEHPSDPRTDVVVFADQIRINPPCLYPGDVVECELLPPLAVKPLSIRPYGPRAVNVRLVRRFNED